MLAIRGMGSIETSPRALILLSGEDGLELEYSKHNRKWEDSPIFSTYREHGVVDVPLSCRIERRGIHLWFREETNIYFDVSNDLCRWSSQ